MQGHKNGTFGPGEQTTRAQFVQILYRLAGEPSVEGMENPFADVKTGYWGYDAIVWAYNTGVVKGRTATTFDSEGQVSREEVAAMFYRFLGGEPVAEDCLGAFPDANKVNDYAKDAMNWAIANGLIVGMGGKLEPQGAATRAQIATVVMRVCKSAK